MSLAGLRGRPILIHAFQMLCPGSVAHAIPQTQKIQELFGHTDLAVIGLHSVFEHHEAMTPVALQAFIHEYKLTFPIGVDQPGAAALPETMARYRMKGTPTTILIDREGRIVFHYFGRLDDLALGATIGSLSSAGATADADAQKQERRIAPEETECSGDGCALAEP
ncbi:MAG: TlpA family protein disulfide reductase [Neomegalonema sp.]|nr:TlpA family protein disulfide reductase [Neomegalonema sp.]